MKLDRAELAGTGAALAFHVALIAALSFSLARVARPPEPPSMEVELVDEVGLQPSAPSPMAAPLPPTQAPEQAEAAEPASIPAPQAALPPTPSVTPAPSPRPQPVRAAPTPPRPVLSSRPAPPQRVATSRPVPPQRASRIGADFLKGIADGPAPSATPARASAPTVSASAMAGIQQAIRRQVQPCADRQINPGPGASKIKVKLHLVLGRSGNLTRPPQIVSTSGVDEDNGRYEERVKDIAVATFVGCAPLSGLPQELYATANGQGWGDFLMNYNLP